jgi:hypothetical protein
VRLDISYREALALQDLVWNAAWAGVTEDICGIEVLPFTPLHYVRLAAARSPFVCGGREPSRQDVDNFLWVVSPLYDPQSRWKKFRHWLRYFRSAGNLSLDDLIAGIDEYMDEAWQDSPPSPTTGRHKSYYSPVVSMMRTLCPAFCMRPQEMMTTPYKCLFQLVKPISASIGIPLTAPADGALVRERARARQKN